MDWILKGKEAAGAWSWRKARRPFPSTGNEGQKGSFLLLKNVGASWYDGVAILKTFLQGENT